MLSTSNSHVSGNSVRITNDCGCVANEAKLSDPGISPGGPGKPSAAPANWKYMGAAIYLCGGESNIIESMSYEGNIEF